MPFPKYFNGSHEIANVSNLQNTLCNSFPSEYVSFISNPSYIIQTQHWKCKSRRLMVLVDSKMFILAATILTTIYLDPRSPFFFSRVFYLLRQLSLFIYCNSTVHKTHTTLFRKKKYIYIYILKMGPMILFIHLKIILLQHFQFSVSAKINYI